MGEVKRYDMQCVGGGELVEAFAVKDSDGEYVLHSDYARLEREHEAAQAELTRLRAVEAAANAVLDHPEIDEEFSSRMDALDEACGRKG